MNKLYLATLGAIAMLVFPGHADSISEQLKVADCNYTILRKGKPIKVLKQMITLRATAEKGEIPLNGLAQNGVNGAGGTGYRSYHIEFSYEDTRLDFTEIDKIEFYIEETLVYVMETDNQSRLMHESDERTQQKKRYFSINLQGIPLLMLDDVTTINIIE